MLGVPEKYEIGICVDDAKCEQHDALAVVNTSTSLARATIFLRSDLQPNRDTEKTLLHEVLHICLADMETTVKHAAEQLSSGAEHLLRRAYTEAEEQTVEIMARSLLYWRDQCAASSP